ncbi:DUF6266 family protein [Pedobacter sp. L105]|uniref:DUF6266 family protein n=1 Tax=Pedobacter sp. L105 TaxID=1641871 RepID=UPI00131B835C|nr:DUF6266 family protein [Pedobacter sp. L105]
MGKFIKEEYAFKGKVGALHGSSIDGKPYVKGEYKKRTKPAKKGEKQNRNKFKMAHLWLYPLLDFVKQGFKGFHYKENSQGYNAAKSHLLLNAFEGKTPDLTINPALAKVSYGNLPLASNMTATKLDESHLKFTWDNVLATGMNIYDQAMLLAYDVQNRVAYHLTTGPFRETGEAILKIPGAGIKNKKLIAATFHCYLAFLAADRSRQSDSVYLGNFIFQTPEKI